MTLFFLVGNDFVKKYRKELNKKQYKVMNGNNLYITDEVGNPVMDISQSDEDISPKKYLDDLENIRQNGQWIIVYKNSSKHFESYDFKDIDQYLQFVNTYN